MDVTVTLGAVIVAMVTVTCFFFVAYELYQLRLEIRRDLRRMEVTLIRKQRMSDSEVREALEMDR